VKRRLQFLSAIVFLCAAIASVAADARPWYSPAGPGQRASLSQPPVEESAVENWILIGIILIGFGVLTIRMMRYRREMEKSILQRLRREWTEGRMLLDSGRAFLKEHFDAGIFPDRRATPRNGERQARA
jgi:hypothetical protein